MNSQKAWQGGDQAGLSLGLSEVRHAQKVTQRARIGPHLLFPCLRTTGAECPPRTSAPGHLQGREGLADWQSPSTLMVQVHGRSRRRASAWVARGQSRGNAQGVPGHLGQLSSQPKSTLHAPAQPAGGGGATGYCDSPRCLPVSGFTPNHWRPTGYALRSHLLSPRQFPPPSLESRPCSLAIGR